ncbi:unnamed protein product [Vitrella brassicaformis CCMP3155]|uniref:Uncharacterized protein n=2 Tax=Vitrella brassicaformis TaxID=1169539 RepID=A0A0G4FFZ9_VITBC|nr:unnamed protein product [Vitrella brassicaformis CCMP3155]|eukprot:CEM12116.1 unnamed protein product [Vitrella brassicaformis CCMP3155]
MKRPVDFSQVCGEDGDHWHDDHGVGGAVSPPSGGMDKRHHSDGDLSAWGHMGLPVGEQMVGETPRCAAGAASSSPRYDMGSSVPPPPPPPLPSLPLMADEGGHGHPTHPMADAAEDHELAIPPNIIAEALLRCLLDHTKPGSPLGIQWMPADTAMGAAGGCFVVQIEHADQLYDGGVFKPPTLARSDIEASLKQALSSRNRLFSDESHWIDPSRVGVRKDGMPIPWPIASQWTQMATNNYHSMPPALPMSPPHGQPCIPLPPPAPMHHLPVMSPTHLPLPPLPIPLPMLPVLQRQQGGIGGGGGPHHPQMRRIMPLVPPNHSNMGQGGGAPPWPFDTLPEHINNRALSDDEVVEYARQLLDDARSREEGPGLNVSWDKRSRAFKLSLRDPKFRLFREFRPAEKTVKGVCEALAKALKLRDDARAGRLTNQAGGPHIHSPRGNPSRAMPRMPPAVCEPPSMGPPPIPVDVSAFADSTREEIAAKFPAAFRQLTPSDLRQAAQVLLNRLRAQCSMEECGVGEGRKGGLGINLQTQTTSFAVNIQVGGKTHYGGSHHPPSPTFEGIVTALKAAVGSRNNLTHSLGMPGFIPMVRVDQAWIALLEDKQTVDQQHDTQPQTERAAGLPQA